MSLRILLMRFGIAAAGGALLAFAATTPAAADTGQEDPRKNQQIVRGEVTARSGLILRSAPTRGGSVIRVAPHGEIVKIFCRADGQSVDGNRQWYLLVDGTWAWGSARYIEAFKTPRSCA
ncbi:MULTISPECIES: SH3 domain-containing protein [Streptomyces]|uniref:SH3 domain-containing protein n=1 Tax=Streptomyces TaxID=1883 RepID=UPI0007659CF2|nr:MULTISPECIES: SH3 domain-containing protein [Streptomyces]MDX2774582.1 SH3 domain-containing protein [Streptomyces europaeiscabiei]MDX3673137.1 SH3 domain-containing protein [Streptomyces europaeiscabiei]MDX3713748.1 SH3 domain-containing protein [Streptomyces europaeiscabiei]MDX3847908.1 SH3 domain-containing protein [Streptomyces europaeiscabiei]MDX3867778.1 SH3 domain-containing protein [Streptomyces europaeiscabiei]